MRRSVFTVTAIAVATAIATALGAAGCARDSDQQGATADQPVRVLASFYPVAEAAARVGGDAVEVVNLTPAGTEPHDLELTPRQVDQIEDVDVVFFLGQGFQPAVEDIAERRDGLSIDLLDDLPLEPGATDEGEGAADPHFWLDPVLFQRAVDGIEATLGEARPGRADTFAANADAYRAELDDLDRDFESTLDDCARDTIVVAHAAFHYLGQRYGLRQEAVAGLSPTGEPDPQRLAELADLIEDEGVTTVFYERLVSPGVAETLAREVEVQTDVLDPLEGLSEERLAAGESYASVMRTNLAALGTALGCG